MTDPITDMLNQIKNAQAVQKTEASVPLSKLKNEIAGILVKEGFITEAKKATKGKIKILKITLKYDNEVPAITGFKRISKPGQRIYNSVHEIRKVRGGYGISIISTSKGLMTNKDARYKKMGGEVICQIW
ncbi:MAG: 30S ribosomal protein S8 [Candidatus Staskawiczbacteria bacterium]|nr:30S ribosomal protein S8 [Candidatus Staskawiczbacteria bacterium]